MGLWEKGAKRESTDRVACDASGLLCWAMRADDVGKAMVEPQSSPRVKRLPHRVLGEEWFIGVGLVFCGYSDGLAPHPKLTF